MTTEISYHIVDFLVDPDKNLLVVLELGEALYNSSYEGRNRFSKNVNELLLQHLREQGNLTFCYPPIRNKQDANARNKQFDFEDDEPPDFSYTGFDNNPASLIYFQRPFKGNQHFETIQDARENTLTRELNTIIIDNVPDSLLICDRDKLLLNTLLRKTGAESLQPCTWYYDCKITEPFQLPDNIQHFVIKPTNESLANGFIVVDRDDLWTVINAITENNPLLAPEKYRPYIKNHQHLLIQELVTSKLLKLNDGFHKTTTRAVFAVVHEEGYNKIDIVDLYWELGEKPYNSAAPEVNSVILSDGDYQSGLGSTARNYWPTPISDDLTKIKSLLLERLEKLFDSIYQNDLKEMIIWLNQQKKPTIIQYYLKHYSHIRVNRLDKEFIEIIAQVDASLATTFLVEQAMLFALPHYLKNPQQAVLSWLRVNIQLLTPDASLKLTDFLQEQEEAIKLLQSGGLTVDPKRVTVIGEFLNLLLKPPTDIQTTKPQQPSLDGAKQVVGANRFHKRASF